MKSYTDLEQSKKLAEILPIESADMKYTPIGDTHYRLCDDNLLEKGSIPCWTLLALLGVLHSFTTPTAFSVKVSTPSLIKTEKGYKLTYSGDYAPMINNDSGVEAPIESVTGNPIDACVEMIIHLHELNLL